MAQASTMIDVIVTKSLTDDFLEQVGLFVSAFGAAEAGHRPATLFRFEGVKPTRSKVKRFVPTGFTEKFRPVGRIHI